MDNAGSKPLSPTPTPHPLPWPTPGRQSDTTYVLLKTIVIACISYYGQ